MKDFLVVGAGLYGAVMARELTRKGYSCIVIDKRKAPGGNIRTTMRNGIMVHEYGAHIFHTSDEAVWKYVTDLVPMVPFVHSPVARYKGNFYSLPFNMHTFKALFGCSEPDEARACIEREARAEKERILGERKKIREVSLDREKAHGGCETDPGQEFVPANLEEQALVSVGRSVYETLIKGYTAKQWGCDPRMLSADIIKRIPIRYTYDEDYFTDKYEGLPDTKEGGYTGLIDKLLGGIEVRLETDYLELRGELDPETWYSNPGLGLAGKVIYTGAVDEFFCECYGALSYRSLRFEHEELATDDFQGHAVVNYTDSESPFTRIIEHKYLTAEYRPQGDPLTVITREYPKIFEKGDERYYPVRDNLSMERYNKYMELASKCPQIAFGGRLGNYRYLDMDKVVKEALKDSRAY
ncbi:MAG: FAD-dependent oxidoreductase [Lachnospiraceae bacterium]|nr:FAD-dependent oxidoreductase [Lachnospiraceae bacterium]